MLFTAIRYFSHDGSSLMAHDRDHNICHFFGTEPASGGMHVMDLATPMFADVVNDLLGSDISDPSICRAAACVTRRQL